MEEFCLVSDLISNPFDERDISEQVEIVRKGRPEPQMPNLVKQNAMKDRPYIRHFSGSQYQTELWLTGSNKLNKLFCWPCLLFSKEVCNNTWTKNGFDNLNVLTLALKRHEKAVSHLTSAIKLNAFERSHIVILPVDQQQVMTDQLYNERVSKNREVLKRVIDVICFIVHEKLPLQESETVSNKNYFLEFLNFMSRFDLILKNHLKESTMFLDITRDNQGDLISCINKLIISSIKDEIKRADFVSLILDETSDIVNKARISTVLRYVDDGGVVRERFLHFTDVGSERVSTVLVEHYKGVLDDFNCGGKLVAHTYDGSAVTSGEVRCLNSQVQELYPNAMFTHSYSHDLNYTLMQSTSSIEECRKFFQSLYGLADFFSNSSKRSKAFQDFADKKLPKAVRFNWGFSSRLLNTVAEYHGFLISFLEHILNNSADWENDTVLLAQALLSFLQNFQSLFLFNLFFTVFSSTQVLDNILHVNVMDKAKCTKGIEKLDRNLLKIRNETFLKIFRCASEAEKNDQNPHKRMKYDISEESYYNSLFYEILDNILFHIKDRFSTLIKLDFFALFAFDMYEKYTKHFPDHYLTCLKDTYASYFDFSRLRNELGVFYETPEFRGKPMFCLIKFMNKTKLSLIMSETYKLLKLIATMPIVADNTETPLGALDKIKSYCKSKAHQKQFTSFALMSIERGFLEQLKEKPTFYDEVSEIFNDVNENEDFVLKYKK